MSYGPYRTAADSDATVDDVLRAMAHVAPDWQFSAEYLPGLDAHRITAARYCGGRWTVHAATLLNPEDIHALTAEPGFRFQKLLDGFVSACQVERAPQMLKARFGRCIAFNASECVNACDREPTD